MDTTLHDKLCEPFPPSVIGWKPQKISGSRALAVAYIDARDVQNRLDRVVGPENWWARYELLGNGDRVICYLTIVVDGREITKTDVGGESDQPDVGDRLKAAFSDSLKRAAVQWGIGRYLYYLPTVWCDIDPASKQIASPPSLPSWALPKKPEKPVPTPVANTASLPAAGAAEPSTATTDTKSDQAFDPVNSLADLRNLAARKGKGSPAGWRQCVDLVNREFDARYTIGSKYPASYAPEHREWLVDQLIRLPDSKE